MQDRFLLCAGSKYAAGKTGGEETHKLTVDEMPSHTHEIKGDYRTSSSGRQPIISGYLTDTKVAASSAGGDKPHNNMPPYLAVYAWKRVA